MDDAYVNGIKPALAETGYEPFRVDSKEHVGKIDDLIVAEIRRSRFVIADFTCSMVSDGQQAQAVARGGVYFEAGFAMGFGIPVVWTCREDLIGYVHFDTRQFSHIVWKSPEDLRERLANRIRAVIGENPGSGLR